MTSAARAAPTLSIVIPVLDEARGIEGCLRALAPSRRDGCEVLVADGGSSDDTVALASPQCDGVIAAPRGRAVQMNAGAAQASGDFLLFLHADTRLPPEGVRSVRDGLSGGRAQWGRFDVRIEGASRWFPLIAALMNLRSRVTGIATGDQAIFCTRSAFGAVGGFPELPLMEDIDFSRRLLRFGRPLCIREPVQTSGRRWERHGVWATIVLMWRLRLAHFCGASPAALARRYERGGPG